MPSSSSSKWYTPGRYVRGSSSFFLFLRSFFFCLLLRTVFRWIPDGFFFFLLPVTTRRLRFCSYDGSSLHTARSVCRNCCCCCDFLLFLSNAMRWIDDSSEPLSNNKTVTDKMMIMMTLSIVLLLFLNFVSYWMISIVMTTNRFHFRLIDSSLRCCFRWYPSIFCFKFLSMYVDSANK